MSTSEIDSAVHMLLRSFGASLVPPDEHHLERSSLLYLIEGARQDSATRPLHSAPLKPSSQVKHSLVWDEERVGSGDCSKMYEMELSATVYAIAFAPDGELLASGGADKHITLWNVQTGESRLAAPLVPTELNRSQDCASSRIPCGSHSA